MVITYMERGSEAVLEKKLDKQEYNDDELLSIKTKLNLPYYTSSADFERAYGSIRIDGVVYEYVKKRVYNDTLELLCLPNVAKTKLQDVKNDLAKFAADGQTSLPVKKGSAILKISLPDFFQPVQADAVVCAALQTTYLLQNIRFAATDYSGQQDRPPQTMLLAF